MIRTIIQKIRGEGFMKVSKLVDELEKDLAAGPLETLERKTLSGKEAILDILAKAADDHKFLARLTADTTSVLDEYDLTSEERAALASGDLRKIESWVGKLDKRLSTWIWCRLQQEVW